jgi:uncharacterized membrane protein
MTIRQELYRVAVAAISLVAAGCSASSDIASPSSAPTIGASAASIEASISVVDLAAGTGLYGRALHINARGYVLGSLGSDPVSPKGFGYWAPSSATFNVIDATATMTTLGKGNAAGDWAEHFNFPRVWLISGESSWSPTTLQPLGSIAVIPNAINANRVVVGRSSAGPVRWEDPISTPALLPLPPISGIDASSANAWGINSKGDIVGSVNGKPGKTYALRWTDNGQFVSILPPAPGASSARATGINDVGVIVGSSIGGGGKTYPMRWTPNGSGYTISTLTTSNAGNLAGSINTCGRSVGSISGRAYVWDAAGSLTLLPLLPGASEASANAINDAGTVIGETKFVAERKSSYNPTRCTGVGAC